MKAPKCFHCDKKPAKRLNLPGELGKARIFCSFRCAAMDAVDHCLCEFEWSPSRGRWEDSANQEPEEN